ncbi:MAG: lytic murein transglycosylase [Candidatus Moranbacteria bacterium]|nr:lytic murein transglycosylase [Candidatus Moranbacteria bacterium]MBP6034121.1 lytic murein transglycosylase [Candidatus Moranbacteria bacterium]MBP7695873.1 lytic murein transglycosylase [Candidatus Moranbacteria bacterium]
MLTRKKIMAFFGILGMLATSAGVLLFPTPAALAVDEGDIQDDIKKTEKKLEEAQKKEAALKQDLNKITGSLTVTKQVIAKTASLLSETKSTISQKEAEIEAIELEILLQKDLLQELIRNLYENGNTPLAELVLEREDMRLALAEGDNLLTLQDKIGMIADELRISRGNATGEKIALEDAKVEHERLIQLKSAQEKSLVAAKNETQSDIESQQQIISRLSKELSELQGDLSQLTGKSYDAKDIRDAVEFASDKTGVPEGVLYGFLKMETNLGANTGQCTYSDVEKGAVAQYKSLLKKNKKWQASIDLLYKRQKLFYGLVDDLGYSKSKKVSCNPKSYIGQGGAMGIPQFMSDVWIGYASQIAAKTGHKTPDPWSLTDGVMAMALKLKKAGATSSSPSVIKSASISYLGGFSSGYYNGIVYWSKNYKLLFK